MDLRDCRERTRHLLVIRFRAPAQRWLHGKASTPAWRRPRVWTWRTSKKEMRVSRFAGLSARLARYARQVPPMRDAQRNEIRMIDAKLVCDAMDFAFLGRRDRLFRSRNHEQASHKGQLLVVT